VFGTALDGQRISGIWVGREPGACPGSVVGIMDALSCPEVNVLCLCIGVFCVLTLFTGVCCVALFLLNQEWGDLFQGLSQQ
jgi:hypothetical protein